MLLAAVHAHFTALDTAVVVAYLALTTVVGGLLAGKQATIRDFFLGGRKIPWFAVSGSIIATEISAVTFISVPSIVFAAGGNLTYLQLGLGAILARVIVGVWFVPAFYEREIFSPYDYMGHYLGPRVRRVTSALFMLGAVLGQSVRVLLTALVLEVVSGIPLAASIWIIGAAAVVWTLLGGITTVIWTDVIQFGVFAVALAAALLFVAAVLPGGWAEMLEVGRAAGKLRLWNLSCDPNVAFTLWAGLLGNTLLCLNAFGTDQLIAQRMFCCRGPREARRAMIASAVGQATAVLAMFVGVGLFAFYERFPLGAEEAELVSAKTDRIFPIFIVEQMPPGITGLVIAGVFAAAISSLDSALAALAQTVVTGYFQPWCARRGGTTDPAKASRRDLRASKLLVVGWGVILCAMAHVSELALARYQDILNLALAMATYTGGALLAAFLLAFLRLNVDDRGILWGTPLSVLAVFAITWHQTWATWVVLASVAAIGLAWTLDAWRRIERTAAPHPVRPVTLLIQSVVIGATLGAIVLVSLYRYSGADSASGPRPLTVAWPWNVPIALAVALVIGYAAAGPRRPHSRPDDA